MRIATITRGSKKIDIEITRPSHHVESDVVYTQRRGEDAIAHHLAYRHGLHGSRWEPTRFAKRMFPSLPESSKDAKGMFDQLLHEVSKPDGIELTRYADNAAIDSYEGVYA